MWKKIKLLKNQWPYIFVYLAGGGATKCFKLWSKPQKTHPMHYDFPSVQISQCIDDSELV